MNEQGFLKRLKSWEVSVVPVKVAKDVIIDLSWMRPTALERWERGLGRCRICGSWYVRNSDLTVSAHNTRTGAPGQCCGSNKLSYFPNTLVTCRACDQVDIIIGEYINYAHKCSTGTMVIAPIVSSIYKVLQLGERITYIKAIT